MDREQRVSPAADVRTVEVSFDSLLDQPQRMMGLVVEVAADVLQDLWRDVGEVIPWVGVA